METVEEKLITIRERLRFFKSLVANKTQEDKSIIFGNSGPEISGDQSKFKGNRNETRFTK